MFESANVCLVRQCILIITGLCFQRVCHPECVCRCHFRMDVFHSVYGVSCEIGLFDMWE